jgi:hypothetical protein
MNQPNGQHDAALAALPAIERQELAAAYGKLLRKETLSRREKSALSRFERDREERLRWQYYGSIPKKHWQRMSGRQVKVINEQAARYGLPISGPVIDLSKFVRAFHDFLARHAYRLSTEDDDLLRSGGSSPALERYREEKALIARLDRLEREKELVSAKEVEQFCLWFADRIRNAAELVGRRFGDEALAIYTDALDDCHQMIRANAGRLWSAETTIPEEAQ